jgi:methylthioribose-1-phosphate isomerase
MLSTVSSENIRAVAFSNFTLTLLDQRLLPQQETYLQYSDAQCVAQAITDMVVRGAPAIGITAAYGVVLAANAQRQHKQLQLEKAFEQLKNSRPTAVNLFWALEKMHTVLQKNKDETIADQIDALLTQAQYIHQQDILDNHTMGKLGASLIEKNSEVYTHCNAGALATGGFGTALGVIRNAYSDNKITQVYAGETRPWLQGARLTAWELMRDGINVKLCSEGAAGQLLRQGNIRWIIVGADRIAANGDAANKIGTYNLAVLAKHHKVKFMVVAPSSTFDLNIQHGDDIPIENRPAQEVTHIQGIAIAPENCEAVNPSFDVTPHELIDAIVCEKGILKPPYSDSIARLLLDNAKD